MAKHIGIMLFGLAMSGFWLTGCSPKESTPQPKAPTGYFQTSFQTESQFVVEAIVTDLAEQMVFASTHQLPDKQNFSVSSTEISSTGPDAPSYEITLRLATNQAPLKINLTINGPIWSPTVYEALARTLAQKTGLKPDSTSTPQDTQLLGKLANLKPEVIERENQHLSAALEEHFTDASLHEEAAVLLGVFLLRDHSGDFFEIRSPLCRLTSHLCMARFLAGNQAYGINGQLAEAMLLSLIGDEGLSQKVLAKVSTNAPAVMSFVDALSARNTGNFLPLDRKGLQTRIENVAWYYAMSDYVSSTVGWDKLSDHQRQTIDFERAANELDPSVEIGHALLQNALTLEMQECASVYELAHHQSLKPTELVNALNELPERCFRTETNVVHVNVIGWGQWADFLQRHLCHAIRENFLFMNKKWGVPDDAKDFAAKCEAQLGGLWLYPFVRRFNCTDEASYHKAVDDSFKITVARPQLVPSQCWNYLCYQPNFAPVYQPNPNPHINEWHNHNPLPGTVYNLHPRLNHPSLIDRSDVIPCFERMHELAPWDERIINFIIEKKYHNKLTYEQAMDLNKDLLSYAICSIETVANTVSDQPEKYEPLMQSAARLNPGNYYDLADYFLSPNHKQEDKTAAYLDKAAADDTDSVRVANHAYWRVRYCLKHGEIEKARQISDFSAEVYSFTGLEAKALFLEETKDYDGAFEYYRKIEERYDDSSPLVSFCHRYQTKTGSKKFAATLQEHIKNIFPLGLESVSMQSFKAPPTDGVRINEQNDLVTAAGLKVGDVIVAVYGIRVHNFQQYSYGRSMRETPELELIVWQGSTYQEVKTSPPKHRFNADFGDYKPQ